MEPPLRYPAALLRGSSLCGKFLLESLYCHIRNITGINFRKDDFRWHLICDFDIRKLGYVKERILVAMDV